LKNWITLQQPQIHLFLINNLQQRYIHRRIISVQLRNCKKPVGTPKSWGLPTGRNDQVSMIPGSKTMRKKLPNAPGLTFPLGRLRPSSHRLGDGIPLVIPGLVMTVTVRYW
jgi:hypothetical protein